MQGRSRTLSQQPQRPEPKLPPLPGLLPWVGLPLTRLLLVGGWGLSLGAQLEGTVGVSAQHTSLQVREMVCSDHHGPCCVAGLFGAGHPKKAGFSWLPAALT